MEYFPHVLAFLNNDQSFLNPIRNTLKCSVFPDDQDIGCCSFCSIVSFCWLRFCCPKKISEKGNFFKIVNGMICFSFSHVLFRLTVKRLTSRRKSKIGYKNGNENLYYFSAFRGSID